MFGKNVKIKTPLSTIKMNSGQQFPTTEYNSDLE